MADPSPLSTREWLDPPGPLRRFRRSVGGLAVFAVLATVLLGLTGADPTTSFSVGMVAVAVLGVSYLALWAVDLVALFTDPDGYSWE